jgi:heme exporter protein C
MSMLLYVVMAFWAAIGWAFNARLASMLARAIAPTGAMFTFLALWTGALWGKPTWGAWWVWDARLTSVFVLFLMYLGLIALMRAFDDFSRAGRAAAIMTLVGFVNIPIIKFSVNWWNTLHQPASVFRLDGPTIHPSLLIPLLVSATGFTLLFLALHILAMRTEIWRRRVFAMRRMAVRRAEMAPPAGMGHPR